ncbi:MAG: helix-turn-helix domain-containing protein [Acidobacteriota bacterium]
MNEAKKARLEAAGWKVGTAAELLELTAEEAAYVELKVRLSDAVRERRKQRKLTQAQLAELMGSSQSRVAKAEASDSSVSLDLLIRSLFALGASIQDLARAITGPLQAEAALASPEAGSA